MKTFRKTQNLVSISNHKYLDNQTDDQLVKFIPDVGLDQGVKTAHVDDLEDHFDEAAATKNNKNIFKDITALSLIHYNMCALPES